MNSFTAIKEFGNILKIIDFFMPRWCAAVYKKFDVCRKKSTLAKLDKVSPRERALGDVGLSDRLVFSGRFPDDLDCVPSRFCRSTGRIKGHHCERDRQDRLPDKGPHRVPPSLR